MTKNSKITMTTDEIVATLKRTSLPTVLIEGKDDILVFRHLEQTYAALGLSVLPVGGRKAVLEVYNRKSELPSNTTIAFIADQDIWVITGIPPEYQHDKLIFTTGYSIENDVFADGNLTNYLTEAENTKFTSEVNLYVQWYALAVARHCTDPSISISVHPEHLLDKGGLVAHLQLEPGETYPTQLRDRISADFTSLLRGKSLMQLLMRRMNHKDRIARHNDKSLIETVGLNRGDALNSIFQKVGDALGA